MIDGKATITDNQLKRRIRGLTKRLGDLRPVAIEVIRAIDDGNRQGLGTDGEGNPLAPLAPSTLQSRDGSGPPLAPQGFDARIVKDIRFEVASSDGNLTVKWRWDIPWFDYHVTGTRNMPKRDITGLRPDTRDRIGQILIDYINED